MDVIAVDDDMLEDLDTRDACEKVRQCVRTCLSPRERNIITLRYGLEGQPPPTQREIAAQCGISRSMYRSGANVNDFAFKEMRR